MAMLRSFSFGRLLSAMLTPSSTWPAKSCAKSRAQQRRQLLSCTFAEFRMHCPKVSQSRCTRVEHEHATSEPWVTHGIHIAASASHSPDVMFVELSGWRYLH